MSDNPFRDLDVDNPYASPDPLTGGKRPGPMPPGTVPTYLAHSILCLICCCWPAAIPAIVFASQVNAKLAVGDYNGAVQSSNNAKTWCIVSVVGGILAAALYALAMAAGEGL